MEDHKVLKLKQQIEPQTAFFWIAAGEAQEIQFKNVSKTTIIGHEGKDKYFFKDIGPASADLLYKISFDYPVQNFTIALNNWVFKEFPWNSIISFSDSSKSVESISFNPPLPSVSGFRYNITYYNDTTRKLRFDGDVL